MKKNKLSLIASLALVSAITFNSCEKIEEGSPISVDTSKTATISGMVNADLIFDERVFKESFEGTENGYSDTLEYALNGTGIHVHVMKQDLNSDIDDERDAFIYSTTVNANGTYTIDIPTTEEVMNVDISIDDFEHDYKFWEIDYYEVAIDSVFVNQSTQLIDTAFGDTTFFYSPRYERRKYSVSGVSTIEVHQSAKKIHDFVF